MSHINLFNYMSNEHGLNLLEEELQEIERMVKLDSNIDRCQNYNLCQNKGKNKYCDSLTSEQLYCYIPKQ